MRVRLLLSGLIALGLIGLYLVNTGSGGSPLRATYIRARSCDGLLPASRTVAPVRRDGRLATGAISTCEASAMPRVRVRLQLAVYTPVFWKSRRAANLLGRPPADAVVLRDLGTRAWIRISHGRADGYLQVDNAVVHLTARALRPATGALRRLARELNRELSA
jgi:hypothetical protein